MLFLFDLVGLCFWLKRAMLGFCLFCGSIANVSLSFSPLNRACFSERFGPQPPLSTPARGAGVSSNPHPWFQLTSMDWWYANLPLQLRCFLASVSVIITWLQRKPHHLLLCIPHKHFNWWHHCPETVWSLLWHWGQGIWGLQSLQTSVLLSPGQQVLNPAV